MKYFIAFAILLLLLIFGGKADYDVQLANAIHTHRLCQVYCNASEVSHQYDYYVGIYGDDFTGKVK